MTLAEGAVWYAQAGIAVFPLKPGRKTPMVANGFHDATTDLTVISAWWSQWPTANIGAPTGITFDVIDVDGAQGVASLNKLYPDGWPESVAMVNTPRPYGRHVYIPVMGAPVKTGLHPAVDTRGLGGYVVVPPSVLVEVIESTGEISQHAGTYGWLGDPVAQAKDLATITACKAWRKVWDTPIIPVTPKAITPRTISAGTSSYGSKALADEGATVASAARGSRNAILNTAAFRIGQLVPHEVAEADAWAELTGAAQACGLPVTEVTATTRSGMTSGMNSPRFAAETKLVPQSKTTVKSSAGSDGSAGSAGSDRPLLHRGIELAEDDREDGALLLDEVRAWLARHIITVKPGDLDILTLWAAHTHMAARLYSTPRLQLDSAVPESGKTTVLEHLERLTYNAVNAASISSPALLARLVGSDPRTLLLDEVDRTLDPKKEGVGELVAIINSGYKVGGKRPTLMPVKGGGWQAEELSTFAPVALAGNQPALPDDTKTRIIRVLLLPDWQGVAEETDWEMDEITASILGARLARWARWADVTERPTMPPGCTGRFREKWQPLARVAAAAGGGWLATVMQLAAEDVEDVRLDREEGLAIQKPHVLVLRHLLEVWPDGSDFMRTQDAVERLIYDHPEVWGMDSNYGKNLTMQRLGRMIKSAYGVRSVRQDHADKNSPRGYRRNQFAAAVSALSAGSPIDTPTEPAEPAEPSEPAELLTDFSLPTHEDPPAPDLDADALDSAGRCRLHHEVALAGCWTCDALAVAA